LNITVNNVNLPVVLDPIPTPWNINENENVQFQISASDPDGIPSLFAESLPTNALFADSGNGVGFFTFTPDYFQAGPYTVLFIASDGELPDSQQVVINVANVNLPPVLTPIGSQTISEGNLLNLAISATDIDDDPPFITADNLLFGADFTDNGDGTASFEYTPDYGDAGTYYVDFIASDGALADTEQVEITVLITNRPPTWNPIPNYPVQEGGIVAFNVSATDPDSVIPTLSVANLPVNATFVDSGNGHGRFRFAPDYTQAGIYDLEFLASDGELIDTAIVRITVDESGNQRPVIDPILPQSVDEGQHLEFTISATDPEGSIPSLSALNTPNNSSFANYGDGTGLFTFNPDYFQSGIYTVHFVAYDGQLADTELVAITVNDVGFSPILDPIGAQTVTEGGTMVIIVTASDPDLTTPILQAVNQPLNSEFTDSLNGHGLFVFTPDFTQAGIDTVLFIASDGALADSEYVEITILEYGNVPPFLDPISDQFVDEGDTLDVTITAYDLDGTIPGIYADNLPPNAVLTDFHDGTAQLDFYPNYYQSGSYNVLIYAHDGEFADSEYIEITVNEVNGPPELTAIGSQIVNEGDSLGIAISAIDPDNDDISFGLANTPDNAYLVDNGNGTGLFYFLPDFTQAGQYNITIYASDGVRADSEVVMIIVVEGGNQAPQFAPIDTMQYVVEGDSLGLIITAHDPDGDMLAFAFDTLPPNSDQMALGPDSVLFYFTPDYSQGGLYTITVYVSDGQLSSSLFIHIEVLEAGDLPPIFDPVDPRFIPEGDTLSLTVAAVDLDGAMPPMITINNQQPHSTFIDNHDGTATYTYMPDYYDAGIDTVVFIAIDEDDLQDILQVEITTLEFNIAPILTYDGDSVAVQGEILDAELVATDSTDGDGGSIYLSALYLPANSEFNDNGDHTGTFTFTPDFNQSGIDSAIFIAVDAGTPPLSRTIKVHLEIRDQNQSPIWDPIEANEINQADTLQVLLSATDPDGDQIIFRFATSPQPPRNSYIIDNGNGTGELIFQPDYTQSGVFIINVEAYDLLDGSVNQAFIMVHDLGNQPPTLNFINDMSVTEGETLQVSITATDPDSTPPALTVVEEISYNRFNFNDNGDGTADIYFEPLFNQSGQYALLFTAADPEGVVDSQNVLLTVNEAGNQQPQIEDIDPATVAEGNSTSFRIFAIDPDSTIPNLSAESLPLNATFIDSGNGAGAFFFSPNYFQADVYPIRFIAADSGLADTQLVNITVTNVNRTPMINPLGPFTVFETDSLGFLVTASDPDGTYPILRQGGTPLMNSSFYDSGNGVGYFSFEPDYSQAGMKSFPFWAKDREDTTLAVYTPVIITVYNTNRPPVLDPLLADTSIIDGIRYSFQLSASDPDMNQLSLFAHNMPIGANLYDNYDGTGTFDFTPVYGELGEYFITFGVSDNQFPPMADSQTIRIEVITGPHEPTFSDTTSYYDIRPEEEINLVFEVIDLDNDHIDIHYTGSIPGGSVFADSGNGMASFTWTPEENDAGLHPLNLIATDETNLADTLNIVIEVITWIRGDANGDGNLTGPDVTYLVQFFNGINPRPQYTGQGDANGDGNITGPDVTYLINYFRGGPPPPP